MLVEVRDTRIRDSCERYCIVLKKRMRRKKRKKKKNRILREKEKE